jgi:RyR domain
MTIGQAAAVRRLDVGSLRDDAMKKHPNLVPYGELSDAEKHYDRDTAMETLRAIIALGYRIERG